LFLSSNLKYTMFLQSQFFFYEIYFKMMDRLRCIILSWNPELERFELSKSFVTKYFCYSLVGLHLAYMIGSSYILLSMKFRGMELSTISISFHLLCIVGNWCCFVFRFFYTTNARELVCIMNSIVLLERQHLNSTYCCLLYRHGTLFWDLRRGIYVGDFGTKSLPPFLHHERGKEMRGSTKAASCHPGML